MEGKVPWYTINPLGEQVKEEKQEKEKRHPEGSRFNSDKQYI